MTLRFESVGHTDPGKVRAHNEDAILVREDVGLWVVADGLGGHSAGDYASSMIVQRLGALPRQGNVFDFIETRISCCAAGSATAVRIASRTASSHRSRATMCMA